MLFRKRNKRGEVEWEIGKIILVVVVFVLLVGAAILLLTGKGKEVLDAIRDFLNFGKAR